MTTSPVIFIVDDDHSVRRGLDRLMRSHGLHAETFASAQEFLVKRGDYDGPGCLVLDVRMPGLSGMELQAELARTGPALPIVFITGHGDIPISVQAMEAGAVDFLSKPFTDRDLMAAVAVAVQKSCTTRAEHSGRARIQRRVDALTPRESEVLELLVRGMLNPQIAAELGITEKTVKVHRARVMRKMGTESLADLVRMAGRPGA